MDLTSVIRQRLASLAFQHGTYLKSAHRATLRQNLKASRPQQRTYTRRQWPSITTTRTKPSLLSRLRNIRHSSSPPTPNPTPHLGSPEPTSLSARMKKLSREYGWSALGVYLGLSALDFPFCFLAVRLLGTDRIGYAEHVVVEGFWSVVESVMPNIRQKSEEIVEDGTEVVEKAGVISDSRDREAGNVCLLYTSPSPRDGLLSRMPSSA